MQNMPDFPIHSDGIISTCFRDSGNTTFADAAAYIKNLPYGRNADKDNLVTVFTDGCGTCSTKHALLQLLALENDFQNLQLTMGIFKMNADNTPKVKAILDKYGLPYIPEAHNYLVYNAQIIDVTFPSGSLNIKDVLLYEIAIRPDQVSAFKVSYHKDFLQKWLATHPEIKHTLPELWEIRENCIAALSA